MRIQEEQIWLKENAGSHRENAGNNRHFPEIIGRSQELRETLELISIVAPTYSTVLILGETGTGKELVARAIHNGSSRKDQPMIKVNCAALPPNLIESELFGHERGSFTGAVDRRIGKFELAHKGTLFLDEIGELPLELQVKLLRALQEKEIERVGGRTTIKVDVRIVTATNRNLMKEVEEGRFRADLFYRLNVFPIGIPALRERRDDIPLLAAHFIEKISKKAGRPVVKMEKAVVDQITRYDWPGNIRELEHVIERSVLLNKESVLKEVYLPDVRLNAVAVRTEEFAVKTIQENERDHIINVLRHCNGKVAGYGGAAEFLGVPPSTLSSKLKRLGIQKMHY
ncbi:MAG: sigma 54-interacting transcriptional regulator [Bacteroidetes bacterium]|nr:sigma 54-interacting transcriptional regulator [Bacteroidota bacterium]